MNWSLFFKAVLGIFAAVTLIPVNISGLDSHPHPVSDYAAAVVQYQRLSTAENADVGIPARSLLLTHGHKTGQTVVLMHGLTNTPRQFQALGNHLYACGYNVFIPRLPFHGFQELDVGALGKLTAERYRDFADSAIDIAEGLGDTISVIGLSGGGTAAAWIAQYRSDVHQVILIAPALGIQRIPSLLRGPTTNLFSRAPNITFHQAGDTTRFVYRGISTRAIAQTLRLGKSVSRAAGSRPAAVRTITLVTNANDHTVDNGKAFQLAARWKASGATVREFQFDTVFHLPHDVIDVEEIGANSALVYPVVVSLLEGTMPVVNNSGVVSTPHCGGPWP